MRERELRIVLDTNTLISALIGRESNPAKVVEKLAAGDILNYISKQILEEVEDVMERPKIKKLTLRHEREFHLNFIKTLSVEIKTTKKINEIKEDPTDNRILECALAARAHYIVTGDKHLLKMSRYEKTKIVAAKEFLDRI